MTGRNFAPMRRGVEVETPAAVYSAMGLIARTADGRALGRTTLVGPLRPVADGFAYVWSSPEEAEAVAARWELEQKEADADRLTAARTADAMGTATAAEAAYVAAADALAAEYAAEWGRD